MPPEEGELHRRFRRKAGVDQLVWSVNIDKKSLMARGLQLLWDTSCNGQTTYLDSTNNGSNPGASQPSHCSLNAALIVFSSCIVDLNVLMPQHMTYNKTILPNFRLIQWTALALCNCSRTKLKKITVIPSSRSWPLAISCRPAGEGVVQNGSGFYMLRLSDFLSMLVSRTFFCRPIKPKVESNDIKKGLVHKLFYKLPVHAITYKPKRTK